MADKVFGMIQPFVPQPDNQPRPGAEKESPDLYKIGCAGYIEKYEKSADGRFFIQLKGVNRFRFEEELELRRGYRRVKAIYSEFPDATLPEGWKLRARRDTAGADVIRASSRHAGQTGAGAALLGSGTGESSVSVVAVSSVGETSVTGSANSEG